MVMMERRRLLGGVLAGGAGAVVAGCGSLGPLKKPGFAAAPALQPLLLTPERLVRMTVCTRPFRPAGPRLEAEAADGKRIIHNYGHGGSGWSLSWGCAQDAAELAFEGGAPAAVAVIGAGVIGLTTALTLLERGLAVTIYAQEFPAETRSARASGVWSPSSRIALAGDVRAGFAEQWERWARAAFAAHQLYVGLEGDPAEYVRQYSLWDEPRAPGVRASREFLHLQRRVRDLTPPWGDVAAHEHPFAADRARSGLTMTFNVGRYTERLAEDVLLRGGLMVRRSFADRAAVLQLPEPVVVNCTGYGAKALFGDESLSPVRGQLNWFPAQAEARYGLYYRHTSVYSRRDGVIVQYTGPNDDFGFGDDSETPDRDEALAAIARLSPLFASA